MKKLTCKKCGGTIHRGVCLLCPMFASGRTPGGTTTSGWPMYSEALAVDPSQVEEANARNKRHGVPVVYDPKNGKAVIPDRAARKKLLRLEGRHDKQGTYGD